MTIINKKTNKKIAYIDEEQIIIFDSDYELIEDNKQEEVKK